MKWLLKEAKTNQKIYNGWIFIYSIPFPDKKKPSLNILCTQESVNTNRIVTLSDVLADVKISFEWK